jgi:hydrogenase maturation protease
VKIGVRVINQTPFPGAFAGDVDGVLMRSFESPHTILHAEQGAFLTVANPGNHRDMVESCENIGTWPVLVGEPGAGIGDTLLSSPIILPDYPRVAGSRAAGAGF